LFSPAWQTWKLKKAIWANQRIRFDSAAVRDSVLQFS
jgi:hypothetical protein